MLSITYDYAAAPKMWVRYRANDIEGCAPLGTVHMLPDIKNRKLLRKATIKLECLSLHTMEQSRSIGHAVGVTYAFGMRPALWAVYMTSIQNGKVPIWLGCVQTHKLVSLSDAENDYEGVQQIIRNEPITLTILSLHETEQEAENMRDAWLAAYQPYFIRSKYILDERSRGRPSKGPVIELKTKAEFDSAGAAARYFKITDAAVSRSLKHKSATAKGFKFQYISDDD